MTSASLIITSLERYHRRAIDDLLFHSYQVHTHLDWYEPVEWLDRQRVPVRLAWQGDRLAGLLLRRTRSTVHPGCASWPCTTSRQRTRL